MADHTYLVGMAPVKEKNGTIAPGEIVAFNGLVYERTRYHMYELIPPEGGNVFVKKDTEPIEITEFYDHCMECILVELNIAKMFETTNMFETTKEEKAVS
jgi:hypothetical protein